MKKAVIISAIVCAMSGPLMADMVNVGDLVKFAHHEGTTAGGEFGLSMAGFNQPELFRTFCMQLNETIDFSPGGFKVIGISDFVELQHDPLDSRTAYLYTKFRSGTLSGYDYTPNGAGHIASANALQTAIWAIEGEKPMPVAGQALTWINEAVNQINLGNWVGTGDVRVLNLAFATTRGRHVAGQPSQDVLILAPAPGAALLAAMGMGLFGWMKRRIA